MTTYVTLSIEDDYAAWALIYDLADHPDSPLVTPAENTVMATLAAVIYDPAPLNILDQPRNERNRHA